jgi:hypothetical protein
LFHPYHTHTMSSVSGSSRGESPSKRARDDSEMPEGMDDSMQAKIARKEARVSFLDAFLAT